MDDTDLRLFQLFYGNTRQSYRDLAERLGLTVQAVHRRIKAMEDEGIVERYTAHLSVPYLGAVPVYLSGRSRAASADEALEKLRSDDSVELVMTSGGNMLFVRLLLRSISELEEHVEFVRDAAKLEDASPIGLEGLVQVGDQSTAQPPRRTFEPSPLDYRILNELHRDSRAAVADIAGALGVSAKTVARRLDRMTKEGVIEFRVIGRLGAVPGSAGIMLITLRPGTDRTQFRRELKAAFGLRLIQAMTYANLPEKLFCLAWAPTNAGFSEMVDRIARDEHVAAVSSHVIFKEYHLDTWRDKLVAENARKG